MLTEVQPPLEIWAFLNLMNANVIGLDSMTSQVYDTALVGINLPVNKS